MNWNKDPILAICGSFYNSSIILQFPNISIEHQHFHQTLSGEQKYIYILKVLLFLGSKSQLLLKITEIEPMRLLVYDYFACIVIMEINLKISVGHFSVYTMVQGI